MRQSSEFFILFMRHVDWLCTEMTHHILVVDVNLRVDICRSRTGYLKWH